MILIMRLECNRFCENNYSYKLNTDELVRVYFFKDFVFFFSKFKPTNAIKFGMVQTGLVKYVKLITK